MKERELIINRIKVIKSEEDEFKSKWWLYIYFSSDDITEHVSDVNVDNLKCHDLVRYFEHIILMRSDISSMIANSKLNDYYNDQIENKK